MAGRSMFFLFFGLKMSLSIKLDVVVLKFISIVFVGSIVGVLRCFGTNVLVTTFVDSVVLDEWANTSRSFFSALPK